MKKHFLFLILCCLAVISANAISTNKLVNGNMEAQGAWQVSYLNTPVAQNPVATWGYTPNVPTAGAGGALHIVGTTTAGNSQICFYQQVTLTAGFVYNFDAAFKNIKLERSWCEVFIGNVPVDGSDYAEGTGAGQGTKIANYGSWDNPAAVTDGTFKLNAAACKTFIPSTTGTYYFVIKMGATTWDGTSQTCEIVVDELSLTETRTKPQVAFTADNVNGFPVMTTTFSNTTLFADSYEWNFGDGSAVSTATNPVHSYATPGTYSVTLKATNEVGETTLTKTNFIIVNEKPALPTGELLYGGNMENANFWTIDFLNTDASKYPVASWNNSSNTMSAGSGANLYVSSAGGSAGIQYAIYQKVSLIQGHVYEFNGAFRDLTTDLHNFWTEVFIGSKPAGNGADYGSGQTMIAKFDIWGAYTGDRKNGSFKLNASTYTTYTATTTGDYYFVAKMGTWDGVGFQIAWDEFTLKDLTLLSTATPDINSNNSLIMVNGRNITVEQIKNNISLFDISGRCITNVNTSGSYTSATLLPGLYIVQIDGKNSKVMIR